MSQELERVYTINLGKALISVNSHRAPRAINMIKEFARHHMKTEDIRIEEDVAHQIWSKGVRSPPRKIRVRMSKTDEGYVLVSPYSDEKESKEPPSKKSKKEKSSKKSKKETPSKEVKETPAKEVKETPAKEVKETPSKAKKESTSKESKKKSK